MIQTNKQTKKNKKKQKHNLPWCIVETFTKEATVEWGHGELVKDQYIKFSKGERVVRKTVILF